MNRFSVKGKIQSSGPDKQLNSDVSTAENWARKAIDEAIGPDGEGAGGKGTSGRFKWEI
jgi:hypothetical protein